MTWSLELIRIFLHLHACLFLNCYCLSQEEMNGTLDGELATVLSSIATACKQIASLVTRAGISNLTGLAGVANIQVRTAHHPNFTGSVPCVVSHFS